MLSGSVHAPADSLQISDTSTFSSLCLVSQIVNKVTVAGLLQTITIEGYFPFQHQAAECRLPYCSPDTCNHEPYHTLERLQLGTQLLSRPQLASRLRKIRRIDLVQVDPRSLRTQTKEIEPTNPLVSLQPSQKNGPFHPKLSTQAMTDQAYVERLESELLSFLGLLKKTTLFSFK